jgi:hypothetical protein
MPGSLPQRLRGFITDGYMKEFTKAFFSYSLAVAFFGLKQLDNMMSPSNGRKPPAIKSLDTLTSATVAQFGETLKDSFRAVDSLQRGAVELMFDVLFPFAASQVKPQDTTPTVQVAEPQRWTECVEPEPVAVVVTPAPEPAFVSGRLA